MQTAQSEDWRPGFAKRAENFSEVCAQAEGWRWNPGETIARVAGAVLKGTPSLTIPQRMTLLIYVEHLNQDRLEQDIACVWPSTALVAEYLGCSQSQARANRRALEAAGFLVRDYTKANRPAGIEAYDLRPLMARLGELEGVDDGIRGEMRRDKRVFVLGEDVGVYGGAFKVTLGFQEEFGAWRVIDTPLSETAIVAGATGAAIMGMRPVAEMQFADFIACGFDQLVNVAGKMHYRQGLAVPITVRLPSGGGFGTARAMAAFLISSAMCRSMRP